MALPLAPILWLGRAADHLGLLTVALLNQFTAHCANLRNGPLGVRRRPLSSGLSRKDPTGQIPRISG
jgi:hypothetical protein